MKNSLTRKRNGIIGGIKMSGSKRSKARRAFSVTVASILGAGIIYAANIGVPSLIIKNVNLKKAMESVTIVAEAERNSEVPESTGISEINDDYPNDITKLFTKRERLIDISYEVKNLENILIDKSDKSPNEFQPEEIRLLARFVPIKSLIEKYAPLYRIDPIWYSRILIAESALNPTSYNEISKDYGIAQLKKERYELAEKELLDLDSRYFSGRSFTDNIYNPETNLIFGLGLVRMNIDDNALKNTDYDVLSVMYNLGYSGIDKNGNFNEAAKTYLSYINKKKTITSEIISAFSYAKTPEKITDARVKAILSIYSKGYSTEKAYDEILSFYMKEIKKPYENEPWWLAVTLDEAGAYANTMQKAYGHNEKTNLDEIVKRTKEAQIDPKTELGNYLLEIYERNKEFAGWKNAKG
ncbi:MAG: transglycosylase SLT domain-containing protein [Candidatus Woesearchaeota archaeon]|nr:transglycosylase SLT domain-containing protein [Candidatus Woesearchaeota archaeon]